MHIATGLRCARCVEREHKNRQRYTTKTRCLYPVEEHVRRNVLLEGKPVPELPSVLPLQLSPARGADASSGQHPGANTVSRAFRAIEPCGYALKLTLM